MKTFIKMLKDDDGASATEYALILSIIGTSIALTALALASAIAAAMTDTSVCIADSTAASC